LNFPSYIFALLELATQSILTPDPCKTVALATTRDDYNLSTGAVALLKAIPLKNENGS